MLISQLLRALNTEYKGEDKDIKYITDDSRKCCENSIFVCHNNAAPYISDALSRGAVLVVAGDRVCEGCVSVENKRKA